MKDLDKIVNDEQLLDFALSHICEKNTDEVHGVAIQIVLLYVVNDFNKRGIEEFTEEQIMEEYNSLIADHVLTKLTNDGLLDTSFDPKTGEILYGITDKGRKKIYGN